MKEQAGSRQGLQSEMRQQIQKSTSPQPSQSSQPLQPSQPSQPSQSVSSKGTPNKSSKKQKGSNNGKPKKISDLVRSVHMPQDLSHIKNYRHLSEDVIRMIREERSDWALSFLVYLQDKDAKHHALPCQCDPECGAQETANMFIFRILCSSVQRSNDPSLVTDLLAVMKHVFFADSSQPDQVDPAFNISLFELKPKETEDQIERLFRPASDLADKQTQSDLKAVLRYLSDRETNIHDQLDKEFDVFRHKKEVHPKNAFLRSFSKRSNSSGSSSSL